MLSLHAACRSQIVIVRIAGTPDSNAQRLWAGGQLREMSQSRWGLAQAPAATPGSVWAKAKCVGQRARAPGGALECPSSCRPPSPSLPLSPPPASRQHGALGFNSIARPEAEELANTVATLQAQARLVERRQAAGGGGRHRCTLLHL